METPATIKHHPLHPMLVALPLGLWIFSLISDIIYRLNWGPAVWNTVALFTLAGGIISALIAAVPGLIDLLSIRDPKLKKTGIKHMLLMLVTVAIFLVDCLLRYFKSGGPDLPFVLSILGVVILFVGGWLGANLVHEHGVGVEDSGRTTPAS
jgi:uncharacterized membrane protein